MKIGCPVLLSCDQIQVYLSKPKKQSKPQKITFLQKQTKLEKEDQRQNLP